MLVFCGVLLGDLYIRSSSLASEGLIVFDTYGTPFLLFFAVKNLMALPKDGTRFFAILFCLGVYLAIWGIYQYATFSGKDPSLAQVDVGVIAGVEQERDVAGAISLGRAVGPFDDSVQFGAVVGICFIWTFFLALYKTRGMIRVWLALALLVMGVAIVISLQRSVWLGFFIAFVAIAVMQRRLRRMIVTAFLVVSVISLGTTLVLLDYSRVEERLVDEYSIKQRIIMYQAALSMAVESPVAGYGKGKRAFVRGRLDHVSSVGSIGADFGLEAGPPHNIFLFTLLQWGLLGLVPYLAILYFLIACSLEIRRLRPNRQSFPHCLAVFFLATTALYVTQGMLMDVAELTFLTSLYFILGGFLEGTRQRIKAEQSLAQATAG
jgi:O-antigen ligase